MEKKYPTPEDLARSYLAHLQAVLLHEEKELLRGPRNSEFIEKFGLTKAHRFNLKLKYDNVSSDPRLVEEYSIKEVARRNLEIDKMNNK